MYFLSKRQQGITVGDYFFLEEKEEAGGVGIETKSLASNYVNDVLSDLGQMVQPLHTHM